MNTYHLPYYTIDQWWWPTVNDLEIHLWVLLDIRCVHLLFDLLINQKNKTFHIINFNINIDFICIEKTKVSRDQVDREVSVQLCKLKTHLIKYELLCSYWLLYIIEY